MIDSSLNSNESNAISNMVNTTSHSTQAYGKSPGILLATAQVYVIGPQNKQVKVKALIDSCSQVSLITQSSCNQLALQSKSTYVCIKGVGENSSATVNKLSTISIAPYFSSESRLHIEALILPKLSSYIPPTIKNYQCFTHLLGLCLADPAYASRFRIDLLLGASVYADIVEGRVRKGDNLQPVAIS